MKELLSLDKIHIGNLDKEFVDGYKKQLHLYTKNLIANGKEKEILGKKYIKNGMGLQDVTVEDLNQAIVNGRTEEINEIIVFSLVLDLQDEHDEEKFMSKVIKYFNMETVELLLGISYPDQIQKKCNA